MKANSDKNIGNVYVWRHVSRLRHINNSACFFFSEEKAKKYNMSAATLSGKPGNVSVIGMDGGAALSSAHNGEMYGALCLIAYMTEGRETINM
jgi:hypothetical protein